MRPGGEPVIGVNADIGLKGDVADGVVAGGGLPQLGEGPAVDDGRGGEAIQPVMNEILAPRAQAILAQFQIAQQVKREPVILDRGEPGINPDIADQPAGGVKILSICYCCEK